MWTKVLGLCWVHVTNRTTGRQCAFIIIIMYICCQTSLATLQMRVGANALKFSPQIHYSALHES